MTKSILTVSAWKLFIGFAIGMVMAEIIGLVVARNFDWSLDYGPYPTLKFGLMTLILWVYPYLVGRALSQLSPFGLGKMAHLRILFVILLAVVNNTLSVYFTEAYGVMTFVVVITLLANIFCLIAVLSFPARELKSIELKRTARFPEFWRELLQFLLWPIFVWRLQPALSSIALTEGELKR